MNAQRQRTMLLDHINIRTTDLAGTTRFLCDLAGLTVGDRPPFSFNGAWLYDDSDLPVIHLVESDSAADAVGPVDHFAFRGTSVERTRAYLEASDLTYNERRTPGRGTIQIFVKGPGLITVELQFPAENPEIHP